MHPSVRRALDAHAHVVSRRQLLECASRHVVDRAVADHLFRLHPQTYTDPGHAEDLAVRHRAAVSHTGGALAALGLGADTWPADIHVLTGRDRQVRSRPGLVRHRRAGFRPEHPQVAVRGGRPVVRLESALVDSWPVLPAGDRRASVIEAVNRLLTCPAWVLDAARARPNLADHVGLDALLRLLVAGCRSELEIWGYRRVFDHPPMPAGVWQHPVQLDGRRVYLDHALLDVRLDIDLDGAAFHGDPAARERDLRRDAALGWQTLRFSHRRLHREPDRSRAEVLAVYRARRRLFAA